MPGALAQTGFALVLSENGRFRTEISLDRERLSIGRRSRNDLVLEDLTVSGEHALIQVRPEGCLIRDLESRNGTHVNGRPIAECQLVEGDCIDIGIYRLRLVRGRQAGEPAPEHPPEPELAAVQREPAGSVASAPARAELAPLRADSARSQVALAPAQAAARVAEAEAHAEEHGGDAMMAPTAPVLEYLTGPYAGITQRVDRNIMRIGDGAMQAAVITRRRQGWFLTHLEGMAAPQVNGASIGLAASPLADGDLIELAGAQVRFRLNG